MKVGSCQYAFVQCMTTVLDGNVSPCASGFERVDGIEIVRALDTHPTSLLVREGRKAVVIAEGAGGG
jgi:hypothetical protein